MKKTVWIARTAVCLALLIAIQFLTKSLGQLVTGSCVNLVLAIAALIGGVWSGVTVAVISPFCAYLLGIGPAFLPMVPCVSLGNAVYALLFGLFVGKYLKEKKPAAAYVSMALAAAASLAGLFGLTLGAICLVVHLAGLESFGISYLAPFSGIGGARALLRPRLVREPLRDPLLRPLDRRNQGEKR